MRCEEVRLRLLEYQRGGVPAAEHGDIRAHLEGCADCTRADAVEQELTSLLAHRLPQHPASLALKRRLAAQRPGAVAGRSWWRRPRLLLPIAAAAVVVLAAPPVVYRQLAAWRSAGAGKLLVAEAVNDHLRVVSSQHPLDIESGGVHQVKPWFAGRLDFAPEVPFEGDAEFTLRGGAVGYFLDRKAAVLVYGRRLHTITLLVFRADGLAWPASNLGDLGTPGAFTTEERGFHVILWRRGELGYALVSDVAEPELRTLAVKLVS